MSFWLFVWRPFVRNQQIKLIGKIVNFKEQWQTVPDYDFLMRYTVSVEIWKCILKPFLL